MADGWQRRFDMPIKLPGGAMIETLADARAHLLSLPPKLHGAPAFVAALEAVLMAAEGRGPLMHANAGMHQLIHGKRPQEPQP